MTPRRKEALKVIAARPGIRPAEFARVFWPDSDGWSHHHKCGPYGSSIGGMMAMSAGAFLAKLRNAGLIENTHNDLLDTGVRLTVAGQCHLE